MIIDPLIGQIFRDSAIIKLANKIEPMRFRGIVLPYSVTKLKHMLETCSILSDDDID